MAKSANPPSPNSGNLVFFRTSKLFFALMTEKSDDDDNDGCNDNYDSNDWNFEDNAEKNVQKTINYYDFRVRIDQF